MKQIAYIYFVPWHENDKTSVEGLSNKVCTGPFLPMSLDSLAHLALDILTGGHSYRRLGTDFPRKLNEPPGHDKRTL